LDLIPYIRELILLNECVILRGVGGFETTYKHASFKANRSVIQPPSKKIHFQPELLMDNGVLEKHISIATGISLSEASEEIDNFVQTFHNELKEKGRIFLNGIGEFVQDNNSRLHFHEIDDEIYLADSFGLEFLEVDTQPKDIVSPREVELKPVIQEKRKLTGWYIIIGILLLIVSITFIIIISEESGSGIFNFNGRKITSQDHLIVFGPQQPVENDSMKEAIDKVIQNKTTIKNALALDTLEKDLDYKEHTVKNPSSGTTFLLIAGSFKSRRNAEIMTEELTREGFNSEILATHDSYYRVVVGRFNDRQIAVDELRRIRKQIEQSVWLWEID
jgi:hypothetical protein